MYIKIFESRQTSRSYCIVYPVSCFEQLKPYIENENHERLMLEEGELYSVIDKFFKDRINEAREREEGSNAQGNGS